MGYDIHTATVTAIIVCLAGMVISVILGIKSILSASKVHYFRIRQQRMGHGWRLITLAVVLALLAIFLRIFSEPITYRFYPPTHTPSRTPTITLTPSITQTPTITLTPSITETPSITYTPFIPPAVEVFFSSVITPNPEAVFSPLQFSQKILNAQAVAPRTIFDNPVGHMYAVFSYDKMTPGVQWTALWFRDNSLVFYETKPWDGEAGGYGYTDWRPDTDDWIPGTYTVTLFVGLTWKVTGQFFVAGENSAVLGTFNGVTPGLPASTQTKTPRPTDTRWPTNTP